MKVKWDRSPTGMTMSDMRVCICTNVCIHSIFVFTATYSSRIYKECMNVWPCAYARIWVNSYACLQFPSLCVWACVCVCAHVCNEGTLLTWPLKRSQHDSLSFFSSHSISAQALQVQSSPPSLSVSLFLTQAPSFFFLSISLRLLLSTFNQPPLSPSSLPFALFHLPQFTFSSCVPLCTLSRCLSVCQGMNNWSVLSLVSRWWDGRYGSICAL